MMTSLPGGGRARPGRVEIPLEMTPGSSRRHADEPRAKRGIGISREIDSICSCNLILFIALFFNSAEAEY